MNTARVTLADYRRLEARAEVLEARLRELEGQAVDRAARKGERAAAAKTWASALVTAAVEFFLILPAVVLLATAFGASIGLAVDKASNPAGGGGVALIGGVAANAVATLGGVVMIWRRFWRAVGAE